MFNLVSVRLGGCVLAAALALAPLTAAQCRLRSTSRRSTAPRSPRRSRRAATSWPATSCRACNVETFEDQKAWDGTSGTSNPQHTKVGSFTALTDLGRGSGLSVINGGTGAEVRSDNAMAWGRYNADGLGGLVSGNWVDSNDNHGIRWDVDTGSKFNALAFFLIDAADVGGKFSIKVGDTLYSTLLGGEGLTSERQHPAGDDPARQGGLEPDGRAVPRPHQRRLRHRRRLGDADRAGPGAAGGGAHPFRPRRPRLPAAAARPPPPEAPTPRHATAAHAAVDGFRSPKNGRRAESWHASAGGAGDRPAASPSVDSPAAGWPMAVRWCPSAPPDRNRPAPGPARPEPRHAPSPSPPRPDVFVVGDAKCGTTTLHRMLQLAAGIGTARTRKELHYFSAPELMQKVAGPGDSRIPQDIVTDEAAYLAEFAHLPPGLAHVADVSPSYLQEPAAAARIRAFAPDARIVILVREPAAKIMSQYTHLWAEGRETMPFEEAFAQSEARRAAGWSTMFDYEAGGRYADAVERYLALFGRDRVMVALFEELVGDDPAARDRLAAFLGIRFPEGPPPRMNMGGRVRSPVMAALMGNEALRGALKRLLPLPARTRVGQLVRGAVPVEKPELAPATAAALRRRYAADVARLEALIGRPTGWPAA